MGDFIPITWLRKLADRHIHLARTLAILTALAATAATCKVIVEPFFGKEGIPPTAWSIILAASLVIVIPLARRFLPSHTPSPSQPRFGFGDKATFRMDRADTVDKLVGLLSGDAARELLIVTGASGNGKSYLLNKLLREQLEARGEMVKRMGPCADVTAFVGEISAFFFEQKLAAPTNLAQIGYPAPLANARSGQPILMVFDQFEDFLRLSGTAERDAFREFLHAALQIPNMRSIVATRPEDYANLRFLGSLGDIMAATVEIEPIPSANTEEGDLRRFCEELGNVVKDETCLRSIQRDLSERPCITPIELQAIGSVLEDMDRDATDACAERLTAFQFRELGGSTGLVRLFFERCIGRSALPEATKACLYVLSVRPVVGFGCTHDTSTLSYLTGWDQRKLVPILASLVDQGIVKPLGKSFRIAHDFFAERICEYGNPLMNPILRDNLTYLARDRAKMRQTNADNAHHAVSEVPVGPILGVFFGIYFVVVMAWIVVSQFLPEIWITFTNMAKVIPYPPSNRGSIPPAAIASIGTGIYTWHLLGNFVLQMRNQRGGVNGYSILTAILAYAALWSLVICYPYWPLCIAAGGAVLGLRIVLATKADAPFWPWLGMTGKSLMSAVLGRAGGSAARPVHYLTKIGLTTLLNMIAIGFAGHVYIAFRDSLGAGDADIMAAQRLEIVFSTLVMILLLCVDRTHGSPAAGVMHLRAIERIRLSQASN